MWNGAWGLLRVWEDEEAKRAAHALVSELRGTRRDLELALRRGTPLADINVEAVERLLRVEPEEPPVSQPLDPEIAGRLRNLAGADLADADLAQRLGRPDLLDLGVLAVDGVRPLPDAIDRALRQRILPPALRRNFEPVLRPPLGIPGRADPEPAPPGLKRVAQCNQEAPLVHAAIVAIEAETVFGTTTETGRAGTSYSRRLYDPNGLFLALVDPRRLLNFGDPESVTAEALADPTEWMSIPLGRVLDTIRLTYDRPEPLVLTVNAGDCVHLTILDALIGRGEHKGLADAMGDAEMPRIVPLNVEPQWSSGTPVNPAIGETAPLHNQPLVYTQENDIALRPSSRFALSLPLPIFNEMHSYGRPFGGNSTLALAGIGSKDPGTILSILDFRSPEGYRTSQIEKIEFYAGLAVARDETTTSFLPLVLSDAAGIESRLPLELLAEPDVREALDRFADIGSRFRAGAEAAARVALPDVELAAPVLVSTLPATDRSAVEDARLAVGATLGGDTLALRTRDGRPLGALLDRALAAAPQGGAEGERIVQVVGQAERQLNTLRRDFELELLREGLTPRAQALKRIIETVEVHYVPYAFGALPLKSVADVIGHPLHGLYGAVTVAPESAALDTPRAVKVRISGERLLCFTDGRIRIGDPLNRAPRNPCTTFVVVPQEADTVLHPLWGGAFTTEAPDGEAHRVRQFTLFWQDGLNHHELPIRRRLLAGRFELNEEPRIPDLRPDLRAEIRPELRPPLVFRPTVAAAQDRSFGFTEKGKQVVDCLICDDSYDKGEKAVSYRSEPFHIRLRGHDSGTGVVPTILESHYDLNAYDFGPEFFPLKPGELGPNTLPPMPVLRVAAGEEVVIHVVHPGGRARQRSFVTIAQDYDDLFPGFGFPRSALLAPGKAVRASLTRPLDTGCYLFFDGPTHLRSGGTWGLIDVVDEAQFGDLAVTSCARVAAE